MSNSRETKYAYKIIDGNVPSLVLSKIPTDIVFYAQKNSCIACSPLVNENEDDPEHTNGYLVRDRILPKELLGENYDQQERKTFFGKLYADYKQDKKITTDRVNRDEPSYVMYKSKKDGQKISFKSHMPGSILKLSVNKLADSEKYVDFEGEVKSAFEEDESKQPYGEWIAVAGSFLVAESTVSISVWHTGNQKVKDFSETKDKFQKFSGEGNVFLEVPGGFQEIPLYPEQEVEIDGELVTVLGEAVDVFPGHLLAFSDGITVDMKSAGNKALRNEENNDYVIHLTAGKKGGYVYICTSRPKDLFEHLKSYIEDYTKKMIGQLKEK